MTRQVDIRSLISHIVNGDGMDKCRICLGETSEGQVHLGDTVMMDGDKPLTLSEVLETVTGVELSEEKLCPAIACEDCTNAAIAALKFRIFVRYSDNLWYTGLKNLSKVDIDENEKNSLKYISVYLNERDLSLRLGKEYEGRESEAVVHHTKKHQKRGRKRTFFQTGLVSTCPYCHKSFSSPSFLQAHFKNSDQNDVCLACGKITSRGLEMKKHRFEAHKQKTLLCKQCPVLCNNQEELVNHVKEAHSSGVYSCKGCGRIFTRKKTFENHTQMHLVRTCRKCGVQFTNRRCYREHRSQCEPEAKPNLKTLPRNRRSNIRDPEMYICDYCCKQYSSRPQLQNHILWIHMDVRPHQCQWCGKRFYTSARLAEHTVVHTRVRNFECDICGAKLVSKMAAVYHRRRHTGEKPYKCEDCGAAFISSSRRLEHAKRKHNKGVRLACTQCTATFVRRNELQKHINKLHKESEKAIEDPLQVKSGG